MLIYQKKPIAQKFNKLVPLPDVTAWRVDTANVIHRGRILCMFRTKRTFLPDDISSLKMRMTTVTKQGDMIVYETRDQGIVINLKDATDVLTECDKYKNRKIKYSRSHIKIRMPQGNIHLFVRDESIYKWTSAILEAHVTCRPKKPFIIIRSEPTNHQLPKPTDAITAVEPSGFPSSPSASSNSGLVTVIERQSPSEETLIPSIRRGAVPVGTLRHKIEKDLELTDEPVPQKLSEPKPSEDVNNNITSIFVLSGGIRTQGIAPIFIKSEPLNSEEQVILKLEKPEEDSKAAAMKEWWMRSLKC
ncbi:hypothetical protein CAEBREN_21601 [Caenorhabditis brenneri]|uniref:DUF7778 domain-containing protein n=1 Tax=Caenorhabditis brenneri TaxID=135651 RepID=G0P8Z2_CAEBE|nr:hypothetical protein CAEBREN_21601 [Caenorhabditis brenneri]